MNTLPGSKLLTMITGDPAQRLPWWQITGPQSVLNCSPAMPCEAEASLDHKEIEGHFQHELLKKQL
jgi:hypothetical protein